MNIQTIKTTAYPDQEPGTSGLRKKTSVFENSPYYLENYIQSCFNTLTSEQIDKNKPIILGGDGRYFNDLAIQQTIRIAIANEFKHIIVCQNGILSTPACSHLIRHYQASAGFTFSASHNPGGINGDVGIKLNLANGGPAPLNITEKIFHQSQSIYEFHIIESKDVTLDNIKELSIGCSNIRVIDGVKDYSKLMCELFDFPTIKSYLKKNPLLFDAMNAVTGPYALEIFSIQLGLPKHNILNAEPKPDFGGLHPDPSPKSAKFIYDTALSDSCPYAILAASDGDGDRNMVLGKGVYINPCDSLAIIAANADLIPYFQDSKNKLTGVARSMPTSRALDVVAKSMNIDCHETPTGWKFFGNLLDENQIQICGEESFGTSGSHIREKDGIWAILCWLNILAKKNISAKALVNEHWKKYGRHYYLRYDFEGLNLDQAKSLIANINMKDTAHLQYENHSVTQSGQFNYKDNTDNSIAKNQGYQAIFGGKARFIVRLSGTGTSGSTLRLYLEHHITDDKKLNLVPQSVLKSLANQAIEFIEIKKYCNIDIPTNIV